MRDNSPAVRAGQTGLGPLEPAGKPVLPLDIEQTKDEETGELLSCTVRLSLQDAVYMALSNSLDIAVTSFDPAVAREQMVEAAAAFDYVLFSNFSYSRNDQPTASAFTAGVSKVSNFQAGVRQQTITGAQWEASYELTRTWDNAAFSASPVTYEPVLAFKLTQPLLRNAWPQFNLAKLRAARINYKVTQSQFRQRVDDVVTQAITDYWQLVQAGRSVEIEQILLNETLATLARVMDRRDIDATAVQVRQTEAAVADRQATLYASQKNYQDKQDDLARLLNDPQINLLKNCRIVPTTPAVTEEVLISEADQLLAALQYNPALEQARLAIATSDLEVVVAENQTLPELDFVSSGQYQGLGRNFDTSNDSMWSTDFESFTIGLQAQYPLGNRAALARLAEAQLGRTQNVVTLQNSADTVALNIRERIREVQSSYLEAKAFRRATDAALAELRALKDREPIVALTPEFLQVELSAQEQAAASAIAEADAIARYNVAMVDLSQITGTTLETNNVVLAMPVIAEQAPLTKGNPPTALRELQKAVWKGDADDPDNWP